jgi:hypothetical protein
MDNIVKEINGRKQVVVEVDQLGEDLVLVIPKQCINETFLKVGDKFIFGWKSGNKKTIGMGFGTKGRMEQMAGDRYEDMY